MEDQHDNVVINANQSVKWYLYQLCEDSSDIIDEFRGYMSVPTVYQPDLTPLVHNVEECESKMSAFVTGVKNWFTNWIDGCKRCTEVINRYHGCPCRRDTNEQL